MNMNTKEKANIAVGKAISYYTSKIYTISLPLNDSQKYDIVVEINSVLKKIQVKYTNSFAPSGFPILSLKSTSGTTRKRYSIASEENCDIIFVYCSNNEQWEIPSSELKGRKTIYLNKEMEKFKIV